MSYYFSYIYTVFIMYVKIETFRLVDVRFIPVVA